MVGKPYVYFWYPFAIPTGLKTPCQIISFFIKDLEFFKAVFRQV